MNHDVNQFKSGFLIINKPSGPTSHDVINRLRKITGIKKIGHAGTLDPFASGVLLVAVGREATKKINQFVKMDKEYEAVLRLGAETDTYDREGKIIGIWKPETCPSRPPVRQAGRRFENSESFKEIITRKKIKSVLGGFTGKILQTPPMFSAKKFKGKKLYEFARRGVTIKREPVEVKIYKIKIIYFNFPMLKIMVRASSGTYIRSLAHDIGQKLGTGAYLEELKRTKTGPFGIRRAKNPGSLTSENWRHFLKKERLEKSILFFSKIW